MDQIIADQDMVLVRGISLPRLQIEAVEQLYGAKLVKEDNDYDRVIIMHLDQALAAYRKQYGRDPEQINVAEDYTHFYKHMPLDVKVHGIPVRIESKPAWFRFPRIFKGK